MEPDAQGLTPLDMNDRPSGAGSNAKSCRAMQIHKRAGMCSAARCRKVPGHHSYIGTNSEALSGIGERVWAA